jgi:hypothetical protein
MSEKRTFTLRRVGGWVSVEKNGQLGGLEKSIWQCMPLAIVSTL